MEIVIKITNYYKFDVRFCHKKLFYGLESSCVYGSSQFPPDTAEFFNLQEKVNKIWLCVELKLVETMDTL